DLTLPSCSSGGVDAPTQAASSQCVFSNPCRVRLYLVLPPVPTSIGSPVATSRLYSAQRVALEAAASLSGAFALACSSAWPYSCAVRLPFATLQLSQASVRLLILTTVVW